jgi:hypothetical protein
VNGLVENNQYTLTPQEFVTLINKEIEGNQNDYPQLQENPTTTKDGNITETQYSLANGGATILFTSDNKSNNIKGISFMMALNKMLSKDAELCGYYFSKIHYFIIQIRKLT